MIAPNKSPTTPQAIKILMALTFFCAAINAANKMIKPFGSNVDQSSGISSTFQTASRTNETHAAAINAITAGLSPLSMPWIEPRSPYLNIIFARIMHKNNDGVTKPIVALIAPPIPATFIPANVAAFIPIGPGVICEIVKISINSGRVNQ